MTSETVKVTEFYVSREFKLKRKEFNNKAGDYRRKRVNQN
jgi:hypothetical protein